MNEQSRRAFLQTSTGALATGLGLSGAALGRDAGPDAVAPVLSLAQLASAVAANEGKKPLRLGLIIGIGSDPDAAMAKVHDLGLPTCQVHVDKTDRELVGRLRQALDKYQIEATSLVAGGPGKEMWDFYQGPLTIGLVPRETRDARIAHIKAASDFAKHCGIPAVQTHCGFIPENPNDPVYEETVTAVRDVAAYCKGNGQNFRYETGQETPSLSSAPFRTLGWTTKALTSTSLISFSMAKLTQLTPSRFSAPMCREYMPRTDSGRRTQRAWARKFPSVRAK